MPAQVKWTQFAAEQFQAAAVYLDEVRVGAGHDFVAAVEQALLVAAEFPYANPAVPGEPAHTRKTVIARYGYWVIYEIQGDQLIVLTVWHAARRPGSWRDT